jgi:uncharacterized membrane protein SpoIIM required for sporulation
MNFENPFETGHIKNYILAYISVVVIVILFFIASKLFYNVEHYSKKEFKKMSKNTKNKLLQPKERNATNGFFKGIKLIDKGY